MQKYFRKSLYGIIKFILYNILRLPADYPWLLKTYLSIAFRLILHKPPIISRREFPPLLNFLQLKGKAVEIGVWKGEFSLHILKYSFLSELCSIDPYRVFDKAIYNDIKNVTQSEFDQKYSLVIQKLSPYKRRSKILRMTSSEAATYFDSETLDFVYIDANHSYEALKNDIELWWPKLKENGIFAGHDYLDGIFPEGVFGVKRAVDEFADQYHQKLFVTKEGNWPSWYLIKRNKDGIKSTK